MNTKLLFILLVFMAIFTSCKTRYKIQIYSFAKNIRVCDSCSQSEVWNASIKKSIVLVSDSTLNYARLNGHVGASTTIKYSVSNDSLFLNSHDVYGNSMIKEDASFSSTYLINSDSLTSLQSDEKYFSESYQKKLRKRSKHFYIVYKNRAYKIKNQRSANRIFKKIKDWDESRFTVLDKDVAKRKFGINEKYKTFVYK